MLRNLKKCPCGEGCQLPEEVVRLDLKNLWKKCSSYSQSITLALVLFQLFYLTILTGILGNLPAQSALELLF